MEELRESYEKHKGVIRERLSEFKANWLDEEKVFFELIFCLLTPQSKAIACDACVKELFKLGIENWNEEDVENILRGRSRFYRCKTRNILETKKTFFKDGKLRIKKVLIGTGIEKDRFKTREWLTKNVRGLGLKESSHFLRNIGFYENIAIIDRHILKNMKKYGVVNEVPKAITKKKYYELEEKLREFSNKIGIPMHELDLLFWASETGFVFK